MLPSVTEILQGVGIIDSTWFTPESCERGRAVHAICQLHDEKDLAIDSIDPNLKGYYAAYQKYLAEAGVDEWSWIECPAMDPLRTYRGTSDRILTARPRILLDIKSGAPLPWHALQTAAYVNMLPDPYSYQRIGLYLKENGTYAIKHYPKGNYATDLRVFMSALTIYNWRAKPHA